jgi:hypothetical protein
LIRCCLRLFANETIDVEFDLWDGERITRHPRSRRCASNVSFCKIHRLSWRIIRLCAAYLFESKCNDNESRGKGRNQFHFLSHKPQIKRKTITDVRIVHQRDRQVISANKRLHYTRKKVTEKERRPQSLWVGNDCSIIGFFYILKEEVRQEKQIMFATSKKKMLHCQCHY